MNDQEFAFLYDEDKIAARLEVWPFNDESSGHKIQESLFYGFCDSGGLATYDQPTREAAIAEIKKEYGEDVDIGTKPEDLGDHAIAVLSGREFIDRLNAIVVEGGGDLTDWGTWSIKQ